MTNDPTTARSLPADVPALVTGGGPVGLIQAMLLAAQGVPTLVVERRLDVQPSPAAHVINARTFEILRSLGVDAGRIEAHCQDPADGAWVRWVTTLTGTELGAVPFERQGELDALRAVTPTPLRNLSQHHLEPILRDHAAAMPDVDVHNGLEWLGAEPVDPTLGVDGPLRNRLRDVVTGAEHEVVSRWLIGADGAGSPVRKWRGIAMDGPTRLSSVIAIHARADLRALVADRPATLYWTTDPGCEGVFVAHDLDRTWVFMHTYDPDRESPADYGPERCRAIFAAALGVDAPFEVVGVSPWTMTAQVAERYRDGHVFLVGDAAHRFPPTGGLGLNTGAADAQNLAWKLGAVERGWADPALLDTYAGERRPVARHNADQSLANAVRILDVRTALGADDRLVLTAEAHAATLADPERLAAVAAAIDGQSEHFDLLGLQLGYVYRPTEGPVLDDGTPLVRADDPVRDYRPTSHPGARLPHVWLDATDPSAGEGRSTLDLVAPGAVVLLTADPVWLAAGRRVAADPARPEPLLVEAIDGEVAAACELPPGGALLVRPDQHVAWRAGEAGTAGSDPVAALADALAVVAGRAPATVTV